MHTYSRAGKRLQWSLSIGGRCREQVRSGRRPSGAGAENRLAGVARDRGRTRRSGPSRPGAGAGKPLAVVTVDRGRAPGTGSRWSPSIGGGRREQAQWSTSIGGTRSARQLVKDSGPKRPQATTTARAKYN